MTAPAPLSPDDQADLIAEVWEALDAVRDPCHVLSGHDLSILDLGLVNRVDLAGDTVEVALTFTEAGCTFGYRIIEQIEALAADFPEVKAFSVLIEPLPVWTPDRLSERARTRHLDARLAFGPRD